MSVGNDLQEMENVVTKGAAKADPMPKSGSNPVELNWVLWKILVVLPQKTTR